MLERAADPQEMPLGESELIDANHVEEKQQHRHLNQYRQAASEGVYPVLLVELHRLGAYGLLVALILLLNLLHQRSDLLHLLHRLELRLCERRYEQLDDEGDDYNREPVAERGDGARHPDQEVHDRVDIDDPQQFVLGIHRVLRLGHLCLSNLGLLNQLLDVVDLGRKVSPTGQYLTRPVEFVDQQSVLVVRFAVVPVADDGLIELAEFEEGLRALGLVSVLARYRSVEVGRLLELLVPGDAALLLGLAVCDERPGLLERLVRVLDSGPSAAAGDECEHEENSNECN
mgnify:CR=1 FL=1